MKKVSILIIVVLIGSLMVLVGLPGVGNTSGNRTGKEIKQTINKGCVIQTVFGNEDADSNFIYKTPESMIASVGEGLDWIVKAQHQNGGWGAGSHYNQKELNPHKVNPDPATTSIVSMAILRSGSNLTEGKYSGQLQKGLNYLLTIVEKAGNNPRITQEVNTQIQRKLGNNIDVVLTAQLLSNILAYVDHDEELKQRVKHNLDVCVFRIQQSVDKDGKIKGAGWAGVLQSSLAGAALESAQYNGADVDVEKLNKSREYQKDNYDAGSGSVKTSDGAGVVLYAVSGSARNSAKEAREVKERMKRAKKEGKLSEDEEVTVDNLVKIGYSKDKAVKMNTSYKVYTSANKMAQRGDVMTGYGNNGGEEFLSFLQTGESMIISKDEGWKQWYDNISGRLVKIQNNDGSWSGHHCITSPVFCTAVAVLILSVNNDIDKLMAIGAESTE